MGVGVSEPNLDLLSINTIRTLSMDAVQAANSGHPGTPMALAPVAYTLWQKYLRYDPNDPIWPDRDRFVLSNGHASMLLYSLLHLAQVKAVDSNYQMPGAMALTLDDLKKFRQIDSKTPGHPEYRLTSGVETTTGPLGQGVATSVGMAMARWWLASYFNKPRFELFNYDVYVICGDGDMMEGISGAAASLAGHHKLSNLCWLYDNNHITIEGNTSLAFSEDVATRFKGYNWNVEHVTDANDTVALEKALDVFRQTTDKPTLIIVDSHIGYGAPHRQDTKEAHGEALGEEEVALTKKFYGWPDEKFLVPDGVYDTFKNGIGKRGGDARNAWMKQFDSYKTEFPALAEDLHKMLFRLLPDGWDKDLPTFPPDPKGIATRDSSGKIINILAKNVPWLMGGAADLYPSTKTRLTFEGAGEFEAATRGGRNMHFGIREHAMAACANGLALCKIRPFASTFFIFTDYCKPAIRLSAIMELPVIYVFTHDSIGVGEDGPTHQPIEHLIALRAVPGLSVIRPADANEVVEAWRVLMQFRKEPAVLVLTRQALPTIDRTKYAAASGVAKGAYILADAPGGKPDAILMGTGSEVSLCLSAYETLTSQGVKVRVVSMPSWDIFEHQSREYRDSVLLPEVTARVSVEQASILGWDRYVGSKGKIIGMHTFGASAPLKELQKKFGFQPDKVVSAVKEVLGK
jgi:transketolase